MYCATKHAVRALNEGLKMDVHGTAVRVTVQPGGLAPLIHARPLPLVLLALFGCGAPKSPPRVFVDEPVLRSQEPRPVASRRATVAAAGWP